MQASYRHCIIRRRVLNRNLNLSSLARQFRSYNSTSSTDTSTRKHLKEKIKISPVVGAAALVLGGVVTTRFLYSHSLLGPNETNPHVRRDESRVTVRIPLHTANRDTAKINELTPERLAVSSQQPTVTSSMDAKEFASFLSRQRSKLKATQLQTQQSAAANLNQQLQDSLRDADKRVTAFADWYFSYKTTYSLLGIALASAAKHSVTFRTEQSLAEAVTAEIQAHVRRKYEALVLRPAVTDPKVHRAFVKSLRQAHADYVTAVQELESSVAALVSKEAQIYSAPPRPDDVVVDMDWSAQLQKVQHLPLAYEKNPELSLALVGAGAAAGKTAGGAAVGAAMKALSAKLAAPFATKAAGVTLTKAATAGAAGGAVLAGPVGSAAGAAAGAAIGLTVDLTVNAGVALLCRSDFEKDVQDSLDATRLEWEEPGSCLRWSELWMYGLVMQRRC